MCANKSLYKIPLLIYMHAQSQNTYTRQLSRVNPKSRKPQSPSAQPGVVGIPHLNFSNPPAHSHGVVVGVDTVFGGSRIHGYCGWRLPGVWPRPLLGAVCPEGRLCSPAWREYSAVFSETRQRFRKPNEEMVAGLRSVWHLERTCEWEPGTGLLFMLMGCTDTRWFGTDVWDYPDLSYCKI